jgi:hypothetical protein
MIIACRSCGMQSHLLQQEHACGDKMSLQQQALGGGQACVTQCTKTGSTHNNWVRCCRVGKMLVHGSLLRCAAPVLTIAAALGHGRPVFCSPPDKRRDAQVRHVICKGFAPAFWSLPPCSHHRRMASPCSCHSRTAWHPVIFMLNMP